MTHTFRRSSPEEDAAIARAIAGDPDAAPDLVDAEAGGLIRRVGRPRVDAPKEATTIRLDPEVLAFFKATGPGWQTRINAVLRKAAGL